MSDDLDELSMLEATIAQLDLDTRDLVRGPMHYALDRQYVVVEKELLRKLVLRARERLAT